MDGVCTGSVCQAQYRLSDCQCTENEDQLCDLCCVSDEGECLSTFTLAVRESNVVTSYVDIIRESIPEQRSDEESKSSEFEKIFP